MKLSNENYVRYVLVDNNPENLAPIHNVIDSLDKTDTEVHFAALSIDDQRLYFLSKDSKLISSRTVLKSGYQSLLGRLGIPYRIADNSPAWVEIPLVNGTISNMSQRSAQPNLIIRMINNEIRAMLSHSYTAIDDKEIISLLERSYLPLIANVSFNCDHTTSRISMHTREQFLWTYGNYSTNMFLYITNSEIGDASVRCGIGISIAQVATPERHLGFTFAHDTRTLGRVIHRGEAIPRLAKQLDNLFSKAGENWTLIQNALIAMSSLSIEQLSTFEERIVTALKSMPEFEAWKTQYEEMRKTSVINNAFDLIYLMTSIPYRDENFSSVVEEIIFGRLF